jgi:adenylate kinase family enzyme
MKRVLIIGSPGAGKTTFARKLHSLLSLPLYHLDYYYHDTSYGYYDKKLAWRKKVTELAAKPVWIIDGNYKSTFDVRFPRADAIVYLDYSRATTLYRAVTRRVKFHNRVREDMPPVWKEKFSLELLRFIWSYNKLERPRVYTLLNAQPRNKQVVVLKNSRQASRFLAELKARVDSDKVGT